ncbi:MAG: secretin and TonB N-terminal domain-containing protein [Armatimonadota bacterium]|nr:secretin and TonB N-terminal domain-containing protein [Armatimonadota bacterium]
MLSRIAKRFDIVRNAFPIIVFVGLLLWCYPGCASSTGETSTSGDSTATSTVTTTQKPGLYDVNASGTDIRLILELLARRSGANIVVSPEVSGQVNAHLKQLSLDAILDYLAAVTGFTYEKVNGTYVVTVPRKNTQSAEQNKSSLEPTPPTEVFVWDCRYAKPADLVSVITKLFPSITCTEGPSSSTPELDAAAGGLTGEQRPTSSAQSGGASRNTSNKIVLVADKQAIESAKSVLEKLDVPRKQVAIDVAVTEISASASKDLGIEWTWSDIAFTETNTSGIGFGKFTKQGMSITGALSLLIKDGKANLLAQPNISVLDGECADILIGDRILYPKLVGYNQIGSPIYDKAEEKVGIYLQIAPKVAGDDSIVLTLYPQVSLVTGYLRTQAGDYPQISTREARTTVSVKNGSTLAIGGLLRNNEIVNMQKLPVLSELPVIGNLFKHAKRTREQTEIVILLSPRIVPTVSGE